MKVGTIIKVILYTYKYRNTCHWSKMTSLLLLFNGLKIDTVHV